MSEVMSKVFLGVLRVVLGPILVWLINKNIISSDESVKLVMEVGGYALVIIWAALAWVKQHRQLLTALGSGKVTLTDVKTAVRLGMSPALSTPSDVVPVVVPPSK